MSSFPANHELKDQRVDTFATFADFNRAVLAAIAAQDQGTAHDLLYRFAIGVEPVRRVALENGIIHAPTVAGGGFIPRSQ